MGLELARDENGNELPAGVCFIWALKTRMGIHVRNGEWVHNETYLREKYAEV